MLAWTALVVPLHLVFRLFGQRWLVPPTYLCGLGWFAGLRFTAEGKPQPHALLLAEELAALLALEAFDAALLTVMIGCDRLPRIAALAAVAGRHGHDLRKVCGLEVGAVGQHYRAIDRVLELPDVAGPVVALQQRQRWLGNPDDALAGFGGKAGDEMGGERGQVFKAFA